MNWKYLFLALFVLSLVAGLGLDLWGSGSYASRFEGGFKGLAGVFFILYFILVLFGKQPSDPTTH